MHEVCYPTTTIQRWAENITKESQMIYKSFTQLVENQLIVKLAIERRKQYPDLLRFEPKFQFYGDLEFS